LEAGLPEAHAGSPLSDPERNVECKDSGSNQESQSASVSESKTAPGPDEPNPAPVTTASEDSQKSQDPILNGPSIQAPNSQGPFVQGDVGKNVAHTLYETGINGLNLNFLGDAFGAIKKLTEQPEPEQFKSLMELAVTFTAPQVDVSWLEAETIAANCEILANQRLLFIVCPDPRIAQASAAAIVAEMGIVDLGRIKVLDFQKIAKENSTPDIYYLRQRNSEADSDLADDEIILIVDAVEANPKAQEFLDSLPFNRPESMTGELQQSHVSILYLADSQDIEARLKTDVEGHERQRDFLFPHWEIPFLRPILKAKFPGNYVELEATILTQRRRWRDGHKDKYLFWKVKELLAKNILEKELKSPETLTEGPGAAQVFNGAEPIRDTVVYVATFFPDLNPREFKRVVELLLADRTKTIVRKTQKQKDDGTVVEIETESQRSLLDIWREEMDQTNRQCSLITPPAPDGTRTVDFTDQTLREKLRTHLEDEYAFFVSTQFTELFNVGLLFDPSPRIGENMVALTTAMLSVDPDYYIQRLADIVEAVELGHARSDDEPAAAFLAALIGIKESQTSQAVYQRITALIRALAEKKQSSEVANDLLELLIRRKAFVSVLKIVRRLRFVSGFDDAYWLKQLIERGNPVTAEATLVYLYGYFKTSGTRIYELLGSLESWIPRTDANQKRISKAASEVLSLFVLYCFQTSAEIDPHTYGVSPSRHPLFALREPQLADENLRLLMRWLFHPWTKNIFSDEEQDGSYHELIAALMFQWSLILTEQSGRISPPAAGEKRANISAREIQVMLMKEVVAAADSNERESIIANWKAASKELLTQIQNAAYATEQREDLIHRRNLLEDLIRQFRTLVPAKQFMRADA
jgi:hypothetical protein